MSRRDRQAGLDAPVRCYYAAEPAWRPRCTLAAEVMAGNIPLCGSCAAARSTLGKAGPLVPLPPGPPPDVLAWITQAHAAAGDAEQHLAAAVTRARARGHSWAEIAGQLGVTRQAAQQRFGQQHALPLPTAARDCP